MLSTFTVIAFVVCLNDVKSCKVKTRGAGDGLKINNKEKSKGIDDDLQGVVDSAFRCAKKMFFLEESGHAPPSANSHPSSGEKNRERQHLFAQDWKEIEKNVS